jgi:ParB-like chromosome segregation protein Spo0J
MTIKKLPISQLTPAPYNPRVELKQGDPAYEKLKRSIETFGYVEPIIYNESSGTVVGGHQRLSVLRDMGVTEVECVIVNLDENDEKALNVALNKVTGEWDMDKLTDLLADLEDSDYDETLTGFDYEEIEALIHESDFEDIDEIKDSSVGGSYLTIGKIKIQLTDEEKEKFLKRLDEYVERTGVTFGFVGELLND